MKNKYFLGFLDLFAKMSRNLFVFMRMYADCLDGGGRAFIPGKNEMFKQKIWSLARNVGIFREPQAHGRKEEFHELTAEKIVG